ncbi:MAG: hypothetical protein ACRC6V_03900 [Bacteroidales bacterium]
MGNKILTEICDTHNHRVLQTLQNIIHVKFVYDTNAFIVTGPDQAIPGPCLLDPKSAEQDLHDIVTNILETYPYDSPLYEYTIHYLHFQLDYYASDLNFPDRQREKIERIHATLGQKSYEDHKLRITKDVLSSLIALEYAHDIFEFSKKGTNFTPPVPRTLPDSCYLCLDNIHTILYKLLEYPVEYPIRAQVVRYMQAMTYFNRTRLLLTPEMQSLLEAEFNVLPSLRP